MKILLKQCKAVIIIFVHLLVFTIEIEHALKNQTDKMNHYKIRKSQNHISIRTSHKIPKKHNKENKERPIESKNKGFFE